MASSNVIYVMCRFVSFISRYQNDATQMYIFTLLFKVAKRGIIRYFFNDRFPIELIFTGLVSTEHVFIKPFFFQREIFHREMMKILY